MHLTVMFYPHAGFYRSHTFVDLDNQTEEQIERIRYILCHVTCRKLLAKRIAGQRHFAIGLHLWECFVQDGVSRAWTGVGERT